MINTILLIIILVVFSVLMFLVYAELKAYTITIDKAFQNILKLHNIADANNTAIEHLLDRFNKRILINEEYFNIIKDLIKKNKVEIHNNQELLYNFPIKLETFIAKENDTIRKQIEKQAKISSKINSKRKQSNNTQK